MNTLSLDQIRIYNELTERNTKNATEYAGLLIPIVKDMDDFLGYIKNLFPEYPDHGLQHSLRILNYISEILTDAEIKSMTDSEIFAFIMGALFHDAGMALYNHENYDGIREEHPEYAIPVIDEYFKEKLGILENRDRFKAVIKFACRAHGMTISNLYQDKEFYKRDRIKNDQIRYSLLAILIRIGDLMDLEGDRTNPFVVQYFAHTFPQESLEHHLRHLNVTLYDYSAEEINIEVCAKSIEQYRIWKKWFSYMNEEILQANTYLKKQDFFFPLPKTIIQNGGDYEVEDIRFDVDETGGIWKIISQSIYTDELDFLRELIQNAIDAALVSVYRNSNIKLEHKSPRSWNSKKHCAAVFVGYSEKHNYLIVSDSGIGMNREDLKRFLFKVSGSGDFDSDKRKFPFPSIASFGIGFISCLINATRIEIYTKKHGEKGCKVSLEDGSNLAFLQKFNPKNFTGTTIKLSLKQQFTYHNIETYVRTKFVYPSVNIVCLNIDDIENVAKVLDMNDELQDAISKSYNFVSAFKSIEEKRTPTIQHFTDRYNASRKLELDVEKLLSWLQDNAEFDDNISDKEKFIQFMKQVKDLYELSKRQREEKLTFPLSIEKITEKDLFVNIGKYTQNLENYRIRILENINQYDKARKLYKVASFTRDSQTVSISKKGWKFFLVLFDDKLQVRDMKITNNVIDISGDTGILFIRQELEEYDAGIEFDAINGFLFYKGRVCNTITKVVKLEQMCEDRREKSPILIGGMREFYDIYEDLEDDFYTRLEDPEDLDYYGVNCSGEFSIGMVYEDVYDVVYIDENNLNYLPEVSFNEINKAIEDFSVFGQIEMIQNAEWEYRYTKDCIENDSFSQTSEIFHSIVSDNTSHYFQDGIKIPCALRSLVPVGFFKIRCNCTADARMALNVTRHKPSELSVDVELWCSKVGYKIQSTIVDGILDAMKQWKLDIDFKELKTCKNKSNALSKCAGQQFQRIITQIEL